MTTEMEARADLVNALHAYQDAIGAPGNLGHWVLVCELSGLVNDGPDPIVHAYNYVTGFGTSPATAIGLLRIGQVYAETATGLRGSE